MASDLSGKEGVEKLVRLHELVLELRACHRESELRHEALIRALEKNGILVGQEIDNELEFLIEELRAGQE